jgi:hypothetical protein
MSDLLKSVERLSGYYTLTIPLGDATLAAQDYLGNTSGDEGVPLPQGSIEEVHVTLTADDDGNTTVQLDNETQDNNFSFGLNADSFTQHTSDSLYFSEDDELSLSVTSVTTPGDGLSVVVYVDVDTAPMN